MAALHDTALHDAALRNGRAPGSPSPALARALARARRPDVRARWVRTLQRLVTLPTVSSAAEHRDAVDGAAVLLCRELTRIGMDRCVILRGQPGDPPSVWSEWRQAPGRPLVLLYGHFDVQPAGARAAWSRPPFDGAVVNGRIHGRGASDNKGPLLAELAGLESHLAATGRLPVNVRVWLEAEEEVGSPHLGRLLDRYPHLLRADGVALSDNTRLAGIDRPTLVTGLRGLVDLRLSVRGPGRALHSGTFGGEVLDPALVLSRMVSSLWDAHGRIAVPGFYQRVRPPGARERHRLAASRPALESLARAAAVPVSGLLGECGWDPGERSTLRPSLTVTGLSAGRTDRQATNAVLASAAARINIRLVPEQQPAEVVSLVARHLRGVAPPQAEYRLEVLASADPVAVPADHFLVAAASRALRATWGVPPACVRSGGTIPVVAELQRRCRMPAAMWGLSRPQDRIHSSDESFALSDFHRGTEVVIRLLHELAC
jgi:acetylornithine deacetylase/succinyl-diaminopimelate desuccinylase-like protein